MEKTLNYPGDRLGHKPAAALYLMLIAWMTVMVGCGDGRPERVAISGRVLIDGKPLKLGYIRFVTEGARPAWANIDPDGRFTLETFGDHDGAVLGTHKILVRASETLGPYKLKWHAPKKYADARTSGLTETIDRPNDNLLINLIWDGGKPFIETTSSK